MKNITLLILIFSLLSCNSERKKLDLIGIYEYKTPEQSENHIKVIDTLNGKYNGLYFGTEDSGGHGVFFYGNRIENLNIEKNKINFEIGKRDLYKTTRFRIVKHKKSKEKDSLIGTSKEKLKYSGEISKKEIKLDCKSEFGYCWQRKLIFKKLSEKK